MFLIVNYFKQPQQSVENAYRYLLEKRSTSCAGESKQDQWKQQFGENPEYKKQLDALRSALSKRGQTLYDLEADLVNRIADGKF